MKQAKHFIKEFITDDSEGYLLNFDGKVTEVAPSKEVLWTKIGQDIAEEANNVRDEMEEACYGYRIDYTITPITTDPFE